MKITWSYAVVIGARTVSRHGGEAAAKRAARKVEGEVVARNWRSEVDCAIEADNQGIELAVLIGSQKQVNWAVDARLGFLCGRQALVAKLEAAIASGRSHDAESKIAYEIATEEFFGESAARAWIDLQQGIARKHGSYATTLKIKIAAKTREVYAIRKAA